MTTIRVKKDANYFAASNEPFNDDRLSWEARGLMGYLLSKPNDWKVNQKDILNKGQAGERKVKRMLAELRKAGYMNRVRVTLEHNKFDWITEVYESPSQNPRPSVSFSKSQCDVLHSLAKPLTGKRTDIVSTELQSTESLRYTKFAKLVMELQHGCMNGTDADMLKVWLEKHEDKWIEQALGIAKANGANSAKYVDKILIGWEAGVYPKTREQQIQERKATPQQNSLPKGIEAGRIFLEAHGVKQNG